MVKVKKAIPEKKYTLSACSERFVTGKTAIQHCGLAEIYRDTQQDILKSVQGDFFPGYFAMGSGRVKDHNASISR